jgi:sulfur carrier protein
MHLVVNGSDLVSDVATLTELVETLGYEGAAVATAVNGEFVSAAKRRATHLDNDDRIEIVAARQGG